MTTTPPRTIDVYCVTCGEDGQADPQTGKCIKCGRQTIRTTSETIAVGRRLLSSNGAAPSAQPKHIELASTPAVRRWVEQTRALAESLTKAAADATARASAASAQAERLDKAATAFRLLLTQVEIEQKPEVPRSGRMVKQRNADQWSAYSDRCLKCGRTERPHCAKGLCKPCYDNRANEERTKRRRAG